MARGGDAHVRAVSGRPQPLDAAAVPVELAFAVLDLIAAELLVMMRASSAFRLLGWTPGYLTLSFMLEGML